MSGMTGNGARLKFRQRKGRRISHANLHQRGARNHSARAADSRLIFSDWTTDAVTSAFGRFCARLKILDFKFHDLRHTAASWMRMGGADMRAVVELPGHKTLTIARRYRHWSPPCVATPSAHWERS